MLAVGDSGSCISCSRRSATTPHRKIPARSGGNQQIAYHCRVICAMRTCATLACSVYDTPKRGTANSRVNHQRTQGGAIEIELVEPAADAPTALFAPDWAHIQLM